MRSDRRCIYGGLASHPSWLRCNSSCPPNCTERSHLKTCIDDDPLAKSQESKK